MNDSRTTDLTAGLEPDAVVTFILREPGMLGRLLSLHVDDGRGRCRVCSSAGTRHQWPCNIRAYADQAAAEHERRHGQPFPGARSRGNSAVTRHGL